MTLPLESQGVIRESQEGKFQGDETVYKFRCLFIGHLQSSKHIEITYALYIMFVNFTSSLILKRYKIYFYNLLLHKAILEFEKSIGIMFL